jgi:cytoskeleton protein RodZ
MSEPIGAQLTRLREARGLSSAEVATALRCDPKVIAALEGERWAELGAPVFSRGHLRRYAEFLGLPADPLLAQWTAEQGAHQSLPDLSRAPQAPRPLDTQRWARRLAMLAGAVVIALAAWWILQGAEVQRPAAPPESRSSATAPDVAATPAATVTPAEVATPVPGSATEVVPTEVGDASATGSVLPAPAIAATAIPVPATTVTAPTVTAPIAPETGAGLAVAFTATERCWAEVVDASGARRLYTMLEPGVRVTARGTPPLRVVLGRGDVTAVEIAGRSAAIPGDALRNAVARFEIAGSGAMRALPPLPAPSSAPTTPAPAAAPAVAPAAPRGEAVAAPTEPPTGGTP